MSVDVVMQLHHQSPAATVRQLLSQQPFIAQLKYNIFPFMPLDMVQLFLHDTLPAKCGNNLLYEQLVSTRADLSFGWRKIRKVNGNGSVNPASERNVTTVKIQHETGIFQ